MASRLIGLDYYEPGVKYLHDLGYNVICADAQSFNLNDKFDVVTAGDLIEHVENPGQMFACAAEHLVDGGKFGIQLQILGVGSTPLFWVFGKMDKINQEHVAWYCPETLKLLGKRYGFEVQEIQYSSRRFWEKIIPLPYTLRSTTINLAFTKKI